MKPLSLGLVMTVTTIANGTPVQAQPLQTAAQPDRDVQSSYRPRLNCFTLAALPQGQGPTPEIPTTGAFSPQPRFLRPAAPAIAPPTSRRLPPIGHPASTLVALRVYPHRLTPKPSRKLRQIKPKVLNQSAAVLPRPDPIAQIAAAETILIARFQASTRPRAIAVPTPPTYSSLSPIVSAEDALIEQFRLR